MSVPLLRWEAAPEPCEVVFSTRLGGVSAGPYSSLNIGLLTEDASEAVTENRRRLLRAACADPERVTWLRQVHGGTVRRADGRGEPGDGIWTEEAELPLLVVTADCFPVALARLGGRPAVGLLHVGWRGLLAGVVANGVRALAGPVVAAVGPGIGACCYEVGEEVATPVAVAFGAGLVRGRRLDLAAAIARALRAAGALRVDRIGGCTACDEERFFSHRRDRGVTGRQGAIAVLR